MSSKAEEQSIYRVDTIHCTPEPYDKCLQCGYTFNVRTRGLVCHDTAGCVFEPRKHDWQLHKGGNVRTCAKCEHTEVHTSKEYNELQAIRNALDPLRGDIMDASETNTDWEALATAAGWYVGGHVKVLSPSLSSSCEHDWQRKTTHCDECTKCGGFFLHGVTLKELTNIVTPAEDKEHLTKQTECTHAWIRRRDGRLCTVCGLLQVGAFD